LARRSSRHGQLHGLENDLESNETLWKHRRTRQRVSQDRFRRSLRTPRSERSGQEYSSEDSSRNSQTDKRDDPNRRHGHSRGSGEGEEDDRILAGEPKSLHRAYYARVSTVCWEDSRSGGSSSRPVYFRVAQELRLGGETDKSE